MKAIKPHLTKKYLLPLWVIVIFAITLIPKQKVVLTNVKGLLSKIEVASNGRSGESYYLYLVDDSHSYLIPAGKFNREVFELSNRQGDQIELKVNLEDLNSGKSIVDIYEIWTNKGPYLRKEDTLLTDGEK